MKYDVLCIDPMDQRISRFQRASILKFIVGSARPFLVDIEVTDVQSGMRGRTKDLSLFGCTVDAANLYLHGTRVRTKIAHGGLSFEGFGQVAYARPDLGMGIVFTSLEPESERILEWWLADLTHGLHSG